MKLNTIFAGLVTILLLRACAGCTGDVHYDSGGLKINGHFKPTAAQVDQVISAAAAAVNPNK